MIQKVASHYPLSESIWVYRTHKTRWWGWKNSWENLSGYETFRMCSDHSKVGINKSCLVFNSWNMRGSSSQIACKSLYVIHMSSVENLCPFLPRSWIMTKPNTWGSIIPLKINSINHQVSTIFPFPVDGLNQLYLLTVFPHLKTVYHCNPWKKKRLILTFKHMIDIFKWVCLKIAYP